MKTVTFLFRVILLLIIATVVSAQPYGWYNQTAGTTNNLNDVNFVNPTTGYIVGQGGIILKTTNAGANWTTQTSGTPNHLFAVKFYNTNTGWAAGDLGVILKTTNGGTTWTVKTSNTNVQLRSIFFVDQNVGFIAGWYGAILKTTDGGNSWVSQNSTLISNLNGIFFINSSTGYAIGWLGKMVKTTNGGTNWTNVNSGTTSTLENVTFINSNTGIISGEIGLVRKTTDGGLNWTSQTSSTGNWLMGVTSPFVNYSTLVGSLGTIRTTTNGGNNWYSQTSNTSYALNKISYCDTLNGWAVGDYGTIIHTTTAGWLLPPAPSLTGPGNNSGCNPLNPNLTWSTIFPPACYYRIQVSTNSNFNTIILDTANTVFSNVVIPSNKLGYNTTYYWRVVATNIAGTGPWSSTRSFTTAAAAPSAPLLAAPLNNALNQILTPLLNWDSVANASSFRVRISTDSNFATNTIDTSGIQVSQYQVPAGKLIPNTKYYWKISAANSCISSGYSTVWNFKTMILTSVQISDIVPASFKIYQNYPNPFNPMTKIKFDIPKSSDVNIDLFDASGREIKELVHGNFTPGSYEYTFHAPNLSSGVYFYVIRTQGFTDIKKMLYIK